MTTGLLLEDTSAPGGSDDVSGPLGQLRKRLTLLQGTQVNTKSSTIGLELLTHTQVEERGLQRISTTGMCETQAAGG